MDSVHQSTLLRDTTSAKSNADAGDLNRNNLALAEEDDDLISINDQDLDKITQAIQQKQIRQLGNDIRC
jgi:hypothetical protein